MNKVCDSFIPNMAYLAPTSKEEYFAMLNWSIEQNEYPVAIRIPCNGVISDRRTIDTNYSNLNKVNELFKEIGLVIKNKNGYLYPFSEKSSSVLSALKNACLESEVNFRFCSTILNVEKINDKFIVNGEKFDKLIVATGGCSYPKTGSVGIGYDIAKNFGHNITDLFPSLVPLYTKNSLEKEWKGIRCEAIVSLYEKPGSRR